MPTKLIISNSKFTERIIIEDVDYVQTMSTTEEGVKVKLHIQNSSGGGHYETILWFQTKESSKRFIETVNHLMINPDGCTHAVKLDGN